MIDASPAAIELALRISLVALGIFIALLAVGAMRARPAVRLLAALSALATGAYAACSHPGYAFNPPGSGIAILFLCAALPALYWAFARAWFDDEWQPGWTAAGAILLLGVLGLLTLELHSSANTLAAALSATRKLLAAALLVHLLWQLWRGAAADLVDERLGTRRLIVPLGGLYILGVLAAELWLAGAQPPRSVHLYNLSTIWVLTALMGIAVARWDLREPPELPAAENAEGAPAAPDRPASGAADLENTPSASRARVSAAEARLIAALERAMREQHLYRAEGLTIAALAERLGTQEHRLRRAINRGLGQRNFNEYLHGYRLAEVAERLRSEAHAHLPILTLALEAGYASIGPFNRAFKARYGVTPSAYREKPPAA